MDGHEELIEFRRSKIRDEIIFLGGPLARASVRIRCQQVAESLGCEYRLDVRSLDGIQEHKRVFVCVKPNLAADDISALSRRGRIVWDVHDQMPAIKNVSVYLTSTQRAATELRGLGTVRVIPQHHCNFTEVPNVTGLPRTPAWIGRPFWCPNFYKLDVVIHDSNAMGGEGVVAAYRTMGLALNVRMVRPESELHLALNDGGKLLNTMAFGIPSVSSEEPAYREYGDGCTLFVEPDDLASAVEELQQDDALYERLRREGLARARQFHINNVIPDYIPLLSQLARETSRRGER